MLGSLYESNGIRFQFPEDWHIKEERRDGQLSIVVDSPLSAFWTLTLCYERPQPEDVLESAIEAFRTEYDELDVYRVDPEETERPIWARDVEFVCFDLLNTACLRAFRTDHFTALVLFQATDRDLPEARPIFDEICESLNIESAEPDDSRS